MMTRPPLPVLNTGALPAFVSWVRRGRRTGTRAARWECTVTDLALHCLRVAALQRVKQWATESLIS